MKMKMAIVGFTSCSGCQVQFLNLEDDFFDLLKKFEIVYFPTAKEENLKIEFDVALVEGSVSTPEEIEKLRWIREASINLGALGTCACSGGVQGINNFSSLEDARLKVYGKARLDYESIEVKPIHQYVGVDFYIPGCPFDRTFLVSNLKNLIMGKKPIEIDYNVCASCKLKENRCFLDLNVLCMGPVTMGGCGAICPTVNRPCEGCWGPSKEAKESDTVRTHVEKLRSMGISDEEIVLGFRKYAAASEEFKEAAGGAPPKSQLSGQKLEGRSRE